MKTDTIFIIHPENYEQEQAIKAFVKALKIKFEVAKGETYNPDFVEKKLNGADKIIKMERAQG